MNAISPPIPLIPDNAPFSPAQLAWLNALGKSEQNLAIVISHDDEQRQRYVEQGLLGGTLQ